MLPYGWDASQIVCLQYTGIHLERNTVRFKCLAQEHNTMTLARAQTQTACAGANNAHHKSFRPPCVP